MGLNLANVHEMRRVPGTEEYRIVKVHPTCSLSRRGEAAIYIQDGAIYYEDGTPVDRPPAWFWEDLAKFSPERRRQLGIKLPSETPLPEARTETPILRRPRPRSRIRLKRASPPAAPPAPPEPMEG